MLIDWLTVVAQAVNFLVLVALLKRFLYGPILRAIDSREARIAERLAEAGRDKADAEALDAQARAQIANLEAVRAQTMEAARQDATARLHEMTEAARESVRAMEARWRQDVEREKSVFLLDLRRAAAAEVLVIARRALADLACAGLEASAIDAFLEKLHSLDAATWARLKTGPLTVVSPHPLPPETRRQIEDAVAAPVTFEPRPEMPWGIELRSGGQRIGWTPDLYLDSLEDSLRATIEEHVDVAASLSAA
jgi:F-type H+-transporting ATPase subunit b